MLMQIADIIVAALLVVAGVFGIVGSWGLVRLPEPMVRLHAPTKAATLGVGAVLIASMVFFWTLRGYPSWHELLISLFLFLTAPLTGLFLAKAHMHLIWRRDELPSAGPGTDWATYGDGKVDVNAVLIEEATPDSRHRADT